MQVVERRCLGLCRHIGRISQGETSFLVHHPLADLADRNHPVVVPDGHFAKIMCASNNAKTVHVYFENEITAVQDVKALAGARVPVVKFTMPEGSTKVDVTINNQLPLINTQLIQCYAAIDERLKQLIFIVKHWAKRRLINDAYRGTLSSYAYVMLCIFIAQKCGLVPVLQQERPFDVDKSVTINDDVCHCQFNSDVARHQQASSRHPITIGGLLTMFFDFFASRFASQTTHSQ